jgi:hypothetical protein
VESEVADGVLQPLPASHVNRRNLSNESAFDESGQSTGRHQPNGAIAVSMRRLRCARLTRGISRERDQTCTACDWHDLSFRSLHRRLTPFYRRLGVGLIAVPITSRSDALYTIARPASRSQVTCLERAVKGFRRCLFAGDAQHIFELVFTPAGLG